MNKLLIIVVLILKSSLCLSQIKGRCIDSFGSPLPYVNIAVQNTSVGTVTNLDGVFLIDDKSLTENVTIIVSHIGYETKSVTPIKNTEIEIKMTQTSIQLNR